MNKEIYCLTKEALLQIPTLGEDLKLKKYFKLHSDSFNQLYKHQKTQAIHIYDVEKNKKNKKIKKIIQVTNHINKTGINPIKKHQKKKVKFYDVTEIYQQNKKRTTVECFGSKNPTKNKDKNKIQSGYLCNHSIVAHIVGIKKIYAYVIT